VSSSQRRRSDSNSARSRDDRAPTVAGCASSTSCCRSGARSVTSPAARSATLAAAPSRCCCHLCASGAVLRGRGRFAVAPSAPGGGSRSSPPGRRSSTTSRPGHSCAPGRREDGAVSHGRRPSSFATSSRSRLRSASFRCPPTRSARGSAATCHLGLWPKRSGGSGHFPSPTSSSAAGSSRASVASRWTNGAETCGTASSRAGRCRAPSASWMTCTRQELPPMPARRRAGEAEQAASRS
jgi:hypothetical protein